MKAGITFQEGIITPGRRAGGERKDGLSSGEAKKHLVQTCVATALIESLRIIQE
jgi:hypothetical protein